MKANLKNLWSTALLAGFAGATMFAAACGPVEGDSCTLNTDCAEGQICDTETNTCISQAEECTTSADCADSAAGAYCINSQDNSGATVCGTPTDCNDVVDDKNGFCDGGNAGDVCLADGCAAPSNCSEAADPTAYCVAELAPAEGITVSCNTDGETPTCQEDTVPTSWRYVVISDLSSEGCTEADTNAGGEYDPGSDIMYVELRDANGQTVAWGKSGGLEEGTSFQNDYANDSIIDGLAPDNLIMDGSEDDGCPSGDDRFNDMTVVSLGCGGSLLVGFESTAGGEAELFDGYKVFVGEYAPICNQSEGGSPTGTTDKYDVLVCPATEAGVAPTITECVAADNSLGDTDAGGFREVTVEGTTAAPAE